MHEVFYQLLSEKIILLEKIRQVTYKLMTSRKNSAGLMCKMPRQIGSHNYILDQMTDKISNIML